jgi:glycine cleavage system H protein
VAGVLDDRNERRYTPEHVWVTHDDSLSTLGVTHYIATQIGRPQHYALPARGARIVRGEVFAEIEAAKVICELTAPVTATIAEVNPRLENHPTALVDHPYEIWLVRVSNVNAVDLASLLSQADYEAYLARGGVAHPLERRFSAPK